MSAGTPEMIFKTTDGGANWQLKYLNTDSVCFFDAMDFADHKHGYIHDDPIDNKFMMMETKDGGESWIGFKNRPDALPGEAAFAASGTCMRVTNDMITIVTGGSYSRKLIWLKDYKFTNAWLQEFLPFANKRSSQGAFSVATNGNTTIFVGGYYADDKRADSVTAYCRFNGTYAGGQILLSNTQPSGFQSCVAFLHGETFISTGTQGSNITTTGGKT